jgi:hypothetical protein
VAGLDGHQGDARFAGDVPVDVVHRVSSAAQSGVVAGVWGLVLEGAEGGLGEDVGADQGDLLDADEAVACGVSGQQTQAGDPPFTRCLWSESDVGHPLPEKLTEP